MGTAAHTITDVRLAPVLVADPPLLNTRGLHQPYTPRLIIEVETAEGGTGVGETYGDGGYRELARPLAAALPGRTSSDCNGLLTLADELAAASARVEAAVDVGGLRGAAPRERDDAAAVRRLEPEWTTPLVPRW